MLSLRRLIEAKRQRASLSSPSISWLATWLPQRAGVPLGAVFIPIAVISTVVLGLFGDSSFYHSGQVRFQVNATTGLTQDQLDHVDAGIVQFFVGNESLPTAVQTSGGPPNVFNEREVLHMNDVRDVIRFFARLQQGTLVVIGLITIGSVLTWRAHGRNTLARALIFSSIVTVVIGLFAVGLTFIGFDTVFVTFHQLVFHNDFWQLDPRTDRLIQMFPFEFWYESMLTVATRVLLVTVGLGIAGVVLGSTHLVGRSA